MKKYSTLFFSLLFCSALFLGCEKEVPFDSDNETSKLVLNSLFTPDSIWSVHVSRSLSVLDNGDLDSVFDATVTITDDIGSPAILLHHNLAGFYIADSARPIPNRTYTLNASAPTYEPVSATNAIPGAVQILNLDTTFIYNPDSSVDLKVSITFNDPAGLANFYLVEMIRYDTISFGMDTIGYSFPEYMTCTDPNIETESEFDNVYRYLLFKDSSFDGQEYTLDFEVENFIHDNSGGGGNFKASASLNLISSSEAFFNYRRSYLAYQRVDGNPFAQPVQVYTNVEGGYGIFAGGTRSSWRIQF